MLHIDAFCRVCSVTLTVLLAGALEDILLIGILGDQAVDGDILGLPNAVRTGHSLQVILQQA